MMPISDDEYDIPSQDSQSGTMSKAELRKTHKPIMEKRRRARINNCLNEIKNLILEAMNKDPARHTKLEKADILEMAVKHLQNVQRQQLAVAIASDPTVIRKFKSGFNDCATEIDRFITKSDGPGSGMRDRVSNHLQKCINGLDQVAQFSAPANLPFTSNTIFATNQNSETHSGDQNNNPRIQIPQGIQLIPSRLPTGELALLVPNSSNLPYFPLPHRPSAFVTVKPQTSEPPKILSPPLSPVEVSKGFRPLHKPKPNYPEDHQVPQISSTVITEVKTMKFPIHKPLEKERKLVEHTSVIRKLSEPLCIITNQGERYKQAQQKEDSINLEENQPRGIKRDYSEIQVPNEIFARPNKIVKVSHHVVPPSSYVRPNDSGGESSRLGSKEPSDDKQKGDQNDMWRPW
ncbi:unnamed protein product [Ceutorhynchus assimilis]|uniref:Uncharacterized protein n=1 Tax=Ceutorhynchus assimilis TaxID=467358 RepID=A0A9N9MXP3_9CUCU|nr:unnamed protein product [Ceutorhynchus assimilis]